MRSTHTYAILEVSPAAHAEIKAKLLAADYGHAIAGDTIDMHGIALEPEENIDSVSDEAPFDFMACATKTADSAERSASAGFVNVKRDGDRITGEIIP